jgi:hypothetical protein
MSADTINHIFGIGYTMLADTNNVSRIRGVSPPTRNSNHDEILVCAIRLPKFPALYAATSHDAALSPSPTPSLTLPSALTPPDPVAPSLTSKVSCLSSSPLMAGEARPAQAPWGKGCRLRRSNKLSLVLSVRFSAARGVLVYCYLYKIVACSWWWKWLNSKYIRLTKVYQLVKCIWTAHVPIL